MKEKEYNILYVLTASLKTLPGKPSGTKPWWREKECRTYLCLLLIKTITYEVKKNQIIFYISFSKALLEVDFIERSIISSLSYASPNLHFVRHYLHTELLQEPFDRKFTNLLYLMNLVLEPNHTFLIISCSAKLSSSFYFIRLLL